MKLGAHDVRCRRCAAKPGLYCRRELTRRPMMGYHRERWQELERARARIRLALARHRLPGMPEHKPGYLA